MPEHACAGDTSNMDTMMELAAKLGMGDSDGRLVPAQSRVHTRPGGGALTVVV